MEGWAPGSWVSKGIGRWKRSGVKDFGSHAVLSRQQAGFSFGQQGLPAEEGECVGYVRMLLLCMEA